MPGRLTRDRLREIAENIYEPGQEWEDVDVALSSEFPNWGSDPDQDADRSMVLDLLGKMRPENFADRASATIARLGATGKPSRLRPEEVFESANRSGWFTVS